MRPIFISYRREDSEGQAGRLFESLREVFGEHTVFMDVATIEPGADFRRAIETNIDKCAVLLSLIGRTWLTVTDRDGKRRLDNPTDFVRIETASALKRGVTVIPVLVQGATMPQEADLPADIKDLAYRNSVELTHARWDSDLQLLINALREHADNDNADNVATDTSRTAQASDTGGSSRSSASDGRRDTRTNTGSGSKRIWTIGGAVAAVALMGAVLLKLSGPGHDAKADTQPASQPVQTAASQPHNPPDQMVSRKELQRAAHARGACVKPFIWRQAEPGDKVCVTPETQNRILAENRAASENRSPNGGAYGPDTCKTGFVWRNAFDGDVVCVTPESRDMTANDNTLGARRIVPLPPQ
ncbi:toll/interleukin-1 receptor domain-containing protein [Paraburkholderia azotifigens]|uniref:Toll/interleukin-1 receptor domain-containing protein n=1 Tax=Paraburkholderia azotifigens TaxID=2057004 RepID=A0A5C6VF51_9BURK|nr:toll/interleukin-1 receptor domain-containing protein [Paraburkholderia azotifigens]TXC84002.1 toll/interleukin-1 receptor domain-containing protein [Paraburkholderia azotifigens]